MSESSAKLRAQKGHILNSPLNKTYISDKSNGKISDYPPTRYFKDLADIQAWNHLIPSEFSSIGHESSEDEIKRVLEKRYDLYLSTMKQELEKLINPV